MEVTTFFSDEASFLLDCARLGIWSWKDSGNTIQCNKTVFDLLGREIGSTLTVPIEDILTLMHPDDRKEAEELVHGFTPERPECRLFEGRIQHAQGHWVWLVFRAKALAFSSDGRVTSLMGMIQEDPHRNQLEQLLLEPTLLQNTLMQIANNFINVPLEHTDDVINRSLAQLGEFTRTDRAYVFNYDHDRKVSSNTYEWCREGIEPQLDELQNIPYEAITDWVEAHFSGRSMVIPDVLALDPDSSLRQILEPQSIKSLIALPMMDGQLCKGFVGFDSVHNYHPYSEKEQKLLELFALMLVNLQNRKEIQNRLNQAIEKAEAASRAKSEFLANMSHEIRTPLNGVIGFTDLLKTTPLSEKQIHYVENANASGHTLLAIINDILDFSKIEAGMMDFEILKTDMTDLLEKSIGVVRIAAERKGLRLLMNIDPHMPRFGYTDPVRLKQIFTNLLSNAVKFTPQGEIELKVRYQSDHQTRGSFHFSIRDTGIGITEDQKNNLFKPFSQADNSTTRKFGGTGLGLIISDKIARHLGSHIEIDNSAEVGTTFSFCLTTQVEDEFLPFKKKKGMDASLQNSDSADGLSALDPEEGRPSASTANQRILIAEDVPMNMLMLKAQIENLYPHVTLVEALNGKEAVERYIEHPVDVIIMDLHMPEMDGIEATRVIREWEKGRQLSVPIIALTADAFINQQERCYEAGMDDFLTKPLDTLKLKNALSAYLEQTTFIRKEDHFRRAALMERCGNRKEVIRQLLDMVHEDLPRQLNQLKESADSAELPRLAEQAHSLKGLALNVELPLLAGMASELEKLAKSGESSPRVTDRLISNMREEWAILQQILREEI